MRFIITCLLLYVACTSCGTTKKLNEANKQIDSLHFRVTELTAHNAEEKAGLSECNLHAMQLEDSSRSFHQNLTEAHEVNTRLEQKLNEMDRVMDNQSVSLNEIRKKIAEGLHQMQDTGIIVKYMNGMIFVSVQDQFLFSSGSIKISKGARPALSVIAKILAEYMQVSAIIVGNTDSLPVSGKFTDNWSLSTERSNAIARLLIRDFKSDPARIVVAGKSQYHPVETNETVIGRSKNRRTDIIINPDLSRLWQLSQKYP
jgi:chemotaxis protein MotB